MKSQNIMRIIMIVLSIMILIGSVMSACMLIFMDDQDLIKLKLTDNQPETVLFNKLDLSESEDAYTLRLTSKSDGECKVSLSFVETETNPYKDSIYAKIWANDQLVCDSSLADLFYGSAISFKCNLSKESSDVTIVFVYSGADGNKTTDADIPGFSMRVSTNN